uniref:PawS-like protein CC.c n=1 Tax=Dimorphotheca sinuata TaxID=112408 RepID=A0A1V0JB71_DIMSI|nr:PawS-like protein CC.c [Dimorphotheca sinuata]
MTKLALVALALAAIVAFFEVSAYRTTITTTTIEDNGGTWSTVDSLPVLPEEHRTTTTIQDNGGEICRLDICVKMDSLPVPVEECRSQIQGQLLNHCQMHLTQGTSFDHKLMMPVSREQQQQQEEELQLCCNQLRQVDEQCQCQAIQQAFNQAQIQQQRARAIVPYGRQQSGQMQQILRKTQMLPNQCKLQVQQCPIQIPRPRV